MGKNQGIRDASFKPEIGKVRFGGFNFAQIFSKLSTQ